MFTPVAGLPGWSVLEFETPMLKLLFNISIAGMA
jgi:hypothetical protein